MRQRHQPELLFFHTCIRKLLKEISSKQDWLHIPHICGTICFQVCLSLTKSLKPKRRFLHLVPSVTELQRQHECAWGGKDIGLLINTELYWRRVLMMMQISYNWPWISACNTEILETQCLMRYPEAQSSLGRDFPAWNALSVPACRHMYRSEGTGAGTRMYSATQSSKREITYVGRSAATQVGLCSPLDMLAHLKHKRIWRWDKD